MRKATHEYIDLVLRTLPSGQMATIRADQEALELMGLRKHYSSLKEHLLELHGTAGYGYTARSVTRRRRGTARKAKLIIDLPEGSAQKTRTIGIELGAKVSNFDLVELAHFIECDWHYLVTPDGKRRSREWWEAKYQKGPPAKQETPMHSWDQVLMAPAA